MIIWRSGSALTARERKQSPLMILRNRFRPGFKGCVADQDRDNTSFSRTGKPRLSL